MIHQKVGIIGMGNMGLAMLRLFIDKKVLRPSQVFATNRSAMKLKKTADEFGIGTFETNEELIDACDVVIVAVKPQDILSLLEPVGSSFHESTVLISLAAGISISSIHRAVPNTRRIVRVMPNTPIELGEAVVGYCINNGADSIQGLVEDLLEPMGLAVQVEEGEEFEALTVSCGSGTGFLFELMQYWQEWIEEYGFDSEVAREMTVQTFLGAAKLADHSKKLTLAELQNKVVSKKGVTAAGLESMRELEIDRALRYSFEKAILRDRELGRQS